MLAASIGSSWISVEAAGMRYSIPPHSASDWILALSDEEPVTSVLPGLLSEADYDHLMDRMVDGLDVDNIRDAAFDAISQASGYRWWEAIRLVGIADSKHGEVVGELALRGVDPDAVPFGRWCAAVFALATRNLEEKDRRKWLLKFSAPPPMAEVSEDESDGDSFADMVRGFRGMPGASMG